MKKIGLGMMVIALAPALASADGGWVGRRCIEESTRKVIDVYTEPQRAQRQHVFFEGQSRVVIGRSVYFGSYTKTLIDDRTRLAGYFDLVIQASGRDGVHVSASLIERPLAGQGAFGHIEVFVPGTRRFEQYLVSCSNIR
jgi:hypothetical protein